MNLHCGLLVISREKRTHSHYVKVVFISLWAHLVSHNRNNIDAIIDFRLMIYKCSQYHVKRIDVSELFYILMAHILSDDIKVERDLWNNVSRNRWCEIVLGTRKIDVAIGITFPFLSPYLFSGFVHLFCMSTSIVPLHFIAWLRLYKFIVATSFADSDQMFANH